MGTLVILGYICAILAGGFAIAAVSVFFVLNIKDALKEYNGSRKTEQVAEIIKEGNKSGRQNRNANIYEELEKNIAENVRTGNNVNSPQTNMPPINLSGKQQAVKSADTVMLNKKINAVNPDFKIDKSIKFVCTEEVLQ